MCSKIVELRLNKSNLFDLKEITKKKFNDSFVSNVYEDRRLNVD